MRRSRGTAMPLRARGVLAGRGWPELRSGEPCPPPQDGAAPTESEQSPMPQGKGGARNAGYPCLRTYAPAPGRARKYSPKQTRTAGRPSITSRRRLLLRGLRVGLGGLGLRLGGRGGHGSRLRRVLEGDPAALVRIELDADLGNFLVVALDV